VAPGFARRDPQVATLNQSHSHSHGRAGATHRWRLTVAFALIAAFFVVEAVTALLSGSLALLGDAGHMAADVVALGAALLATQLAARPDETGRRTFGSYRAEVFASGLAVLLMVVVSIYVTVEAIGRWRDEGVAVGGLPVPMLVVGGLGLVVNLIAMALLRGGAGESLNVKGAYLEVLADTLGSVGVVVAGLLVAVTGLPAWDTLVALAIAAFVVVRAVVLGREVLAVLGQHAPAHLHPDDVAAALAAVPDVRDVHDLHLWTLTSGMTVATAHLVTAESADAHAVLDDAGAVLRERFDVEHATLQVEPITHAGCDRISW
jgi:cobalt-zinc-cadmium efflux system protein